MHDSYAVIAYANGLFGIVEDVTGNVEVVLRKNEGSSAVLRRSPRSVCEAKWNELRRHVANSAGSGI